MLRELVEKLEEMALAGSKSRITNIDGVPYIENSKGYTILRDIQFDCLKVNTLSSVVKSVFSLIDDAPDNLEAPFVVNVKGNNVCVYSNLSRQGNRERLIEAEPQTPHLDFSSYMSVENMLIRLSTAFEPTENTEYLIQALSNIRVVEE